MEYEADECHLVDPETHTLTGAYYRDENPPARKDATPLLRAAAKQGNDLSKMEMKLPNDITVYGSRNDAARLSEIVNEIPQLWMNKG